MPREGAIINRVMMEISRAGGRAFRNNVGKFQDATGRWVTYGVCNPGGSDLIGWTPVVVTQEMVGQRVAVFTAVECKTGRLQPTKEQARFISAVQAAGGIARVERG